MKYTNLSHLILKRYPVNDDNTLSFALIAQILFQTFIDEESANEKLKLLSEKYSYRMLKKELEQFFDTERLQIFLMLKEAIDDPIEKKWDTISIPFNETEDDPKYEKRTSLSRKFLNTVKNTPLIKEKKLTQALHAVYLKALTNGNEEAATDCRKLLKEMLSYDLGPIPKANKVISKDYFYGVREQWSKFLDTENENLINRTYEYIDGNQYRLLEFLTITLLNKTFDHQIYTTLNFVEQVFQSEHLKKASKDACICSRREYKEEDEILTLYEYRGSSAVFYKELPKKLENSAAIVVNGQNLRIQSRLAFDFFLDQSAKKIIVIKDCEKIPEEDKHILIDLLQKRTYKDYRLPPETLIALEIKHCLPDYLLFDILGIVMHC